MPESEKTNDLDVLGNIARAMQIRKLVGDKLDKVLAAGDPEKIGPELAAILKEVADLASLSETEAAGIYKIVAKDSYLSNQEYVMPDELRGIHKKMVDFFNSDKGVDSLPYSGLMLYGPGGVGKSEYVNYLMGAIPDSVELVIVHISEILNSDQPGRTLSRLYEDLEKRAKEKGVKIILEFDEYEQLTNQTLREDKTSRRSENIKPALFGESEVTRFNEMTDVVIRDNRGLEILAALKSAISGTHTIKNVFTITTSNQAEQSEELKREGRLKAIEMRPCHFDLRKLESDSVAPINLLFDDVFRMFQCTHFRLYGEFNSVLEKLHAEVKDKALDRFAKFVKHNGQDFAFRNTAKILEDIFGGNFSELHLQITYKRSKIAGFYKEHVEEFKEIEKAKRLIREFLLGGS